MSENNNDEELEKIRKKKLEERMSEMTEPKDEGNELPDGPIVVTDSNFVETIKKYPMVVVDCWAPWCGPCQVVGPVIEELARDYKGKIVFGKLNVDENRKTAGNFGIMSIPTLLIFKDGEPVDTQVGAMPKQVLEPIIKKHL